MENNDKIIVYYSFDGNSEYVAGYIKDKTGCDVLRLIPETEPPRKGLGKFLKGGGAALKESDIPLKEYSFDPEKYSVVILAMPVWAGTFPPAIGTFIRSNDLTGKKVHVVACSASGNAEKLFEKIYARLGTEKGGTCSLKSPLRNREESERSLDAFISAISNYA